MSLLDDIKAQDRVYYSSLDIAQLEKAEEALVALLNISYLNEENRKLADSLRIRICVKRIAITLIEKNLSIKNMKELISQLQEYVSVAMSKEYVNTARLALRIVDFATALDEIYTECSKARLEYRSPDGQIAPLNEGSCIKARAIYRDKINECALLPDATELFGRVSFLDPKAELTELMESLCDEADDARRTFSESHYTETLKKSIEDVPSEWSKFKYKPGISAEQTAERLTVVCTPIESEFRFFVYSYAQANKSRLVFVNTEDFSKYADDEIPTLINMIAEKGNCFAVLGLSNYRAYNKEALIRAFYSIPQIKPGSVVFFRDHSGARRLWTETEKVLGDQPDISYYYHSMPNYGETLELFRSEGLIDSPDDEEFLKKHCAFMGFLGLNAAIDSRNWKETAAEHSADNAGFIEGYFRELPSQSQLLDAGWGEHSPYPPDISTPKKPFSFDYDEKRICNPENIEYIANFPELTLAERCGLMVRYCLLLGEDVSSWKELSDEVRLDRLTVATKTVGRLLAVQYDPIVEYPQSIDGKAGGYCAGRGKKIAYQKSSIGNYDWIAKTVCHEMYHSFQNTAIDLGWKIWHYTDLSVSKFRVAEWAENDSRHFDIDKNFNAYYVQTKEADARVFENDSFEGAESKWHLLSLK